MFFPGRVSGAPGLCKSYLRQPCTPSNTSPTLPSGPLDKVVLIGGPDDQLSTWLPHTVHQSHPEAQPQPVGCGRVEGKLSLSVLKYRFLFESFPKCLLAILRTSFGKMAHILIM